VTASAAAPRPISRPRSLTGPFCAAAAVGAIGAIALGLALGAAPDERWRLAARYTARLAFSIFVPVYVASSWHRLAPSAASRFVVQRRRSLGLAFATAHTIHLGALTTFAILAHQPPRFSAIAVGGGAYLAMFAMAATSNDAAVRRLGRWWSRLHRVGVHWLWFVFAFTYASRIAAGNRAFVPFEAVALAALALRIAAARRRRPRLLRVAGR
jgi:methionine sulfoxide reductase heme-binding subunit